MRIDPKIDYYRVLGVQPHASPDEIRKAFRSLAKLHHPDMTRDSDREPFQHVALAYDILSSHEHRERYDNLRASMSSTRQQTVAERRDESTPSSSPPTPSASQSTGTEDIQEERASPPLEQPSQIVSRWNLGFWIGVGLALVVTCVVDGTGFLLDEIGTAITYLPILIPAFLLLPPLLYIVVFFVISRVKDRIRRRSSS